MDPAQIITQAIIVNSRQDVREEKEENGWPFVINLNRAFPSLAAYCIHLFVDNFYIVYHFLECLTLLF